MAVAVGFEPTVRLPPHALSRRAPLAARTRHRRKDYKLCGPGHEGAPWAGPFTSATTVRWSWLWNHLLFYPRFQTARCGPFWTNLFNALDLIQGNADGWPLGWNDTASSAVVPVIGLLIVGPQGAK